MPVKDDSKDDSDERSASCSPILELEEEDNLDTLEEMHQEDMRRKEARRERREEHRKDTLGSESILYHGLYGTYRVSDLLFSAKNTKTKSDNQHGVNYQPTR
ncbi:MAG: hypothetical protein QNK11_07810 [Legionella sp.]|nr:hypothetical protein [Legionella sp.]